MENSHLDTELIQCSWSTAWPHHTFPAPSKHYMYPKTLLAIVSCTELSFSEYIVHRNQIFLFCSL